MLSQSALVSLPIQESLWTLLDLPPDSTKEAIDTRYQALAAAGKADYAIRRAWKILRDPFYREAYRLYPSVALMEQAGFFDDGLNMDLSAAPNWDTRFMTTAVDKIAQHLARLPAGRRAAVLVSTGSFSPLHIGHLEMMDMARAHLEQQGIPVVGGYFSPSHDAYVSTKYGGTAALSIAHRLQLCHLALADNDWLMAEPWEARYNTVSLNFTDVLLRLDAYLQRHLPQAAIDLYYVFGSDNTGFSLAFTGRGQCVCIERGHMTAEQGALMAELQAQYPERIHLVPNGKRSRQYSSSDIRAGDYQQLPETIQALYASWRTARFSDTEAAGRYLLRDDTQWACRRWGIDPGRLRSRVRALSHLLETAFKNAEAPDSPLPMSVLRLPLAAQQQHVTALEAQTPVIALDAATQAQHAIRLSRLFALSDGQIFSKELVASPGHAELSQQLAAIPPGTYVMVEDDIATGQTCRQVSEALKGVAAIQRVEALAQWSFHQLFGAEVPYRVHDIVDARDFILGAEEGGLVVKLPNGELARAPYALPYVNLIARAKIPPSTEMRLSQAIWAMNVRFFERVAPQLCVKDAAEASRRLLRYLGFDEHTSLAEVARWHLQQLKSFSY